jgi:RNA polymerase sigma factor (sigma-70 family)
MADDRSAKIAEYSAFYMENVPRLVAFLVSEGRSVSDAADCVQEALIEALKKWKTLEHPYAWCRKVAYRKACKLDRQRREEPMSEPELSGSPLIAPNTDFEHLEAEHELLYYLAQLPDRERQVFAWICDGATAAEIAEELGMEAATVRSTLRNARARLHRLQAEAASASER